jgi:hypothetical protein
MKLGTPIIAPGTSEAQESEQNLMFPSNYYYAYGNWAAKTVSVAADRYKILSPADGALKINGSMYGWTSQQTLDLSSEATWDTVAGTDYRTAANRAGKDFYVYACEPTSGLTPAFKASANASAPSGYTTANSRLIGGGHCLCVSVGTIASHTLTGYVTGDILPQSVWDVKHRPHSSPVGMVYSSDLDLWVDIYHPSGTGVNTTSAFAATTSVSRNWSDTADDLATVGKTLLDDMQFQSIAAGSNEQTVIYGSQAPVLTGNIETKKFTGAGLNDATYSRASWVAPAGDNQEYEIEIDATGTPNTFKWRQKVFGGSFGSYTTGVAITAGAILLADGLTVTFGATTGHTLGDKWNLYVMNAGFDTAARRMISNIGVEMACGAYGQWLRNGHYYFGSPVTHTHSVTVSGDPQTVTSGAPSAAPTPANAWYSPGGSKGSRNCQGSLSVKGKAGGDYSSTTNAGSRCVTLTTTIDAAQAWTTGRGCSRPRVTT